MPRSVPAAVALLAWLAAFPAGAAFHLWTMTELYSNADGTVQFLELSAITGGQQFLSGHTLRSTSGGTSRTFTFSNDLPGDTPNGRRMLVGTQGFAALGIVAPDYVVPNGFFFQGGGSINFGEGADLWNHGALPAPPLSLNRGGSTSTNSPRNFAGQTGSIAASAPPPTPSFNVQAIWERSPAGSESGWGVNITHQGDVLFVTWFTYDLDGSGLWFSSDAHKVATNAYSGQIYQSRGSPFDSVPYDSGRFTIAPVGTVTFEFTDASNGTFRYTVNGITQSKPITRYLFSNPMAVCTQGGAPGALPNYDDMWLAAPPGELGWGVNITHQGDILFATWFTYAADGTDMWMVMSAGRKVAERTYTGEIHRTTGAPFNAYDRSRFIATLVGSGTFTFTDNDNGMFTYTVDGVTQTKTITRYVFAFPTTTCTFPGTMDPAPMGPYPKAGGPG
jgi:hypothetical protein